MRLDIGEFGIFEGKKVPLDFPMPLNEKKKSKKKKNPPLNKPTLNSVEKVYSFVTQNREISENYLWRQERWPKRQLE